MKDTEIEKLRQQLSVKDERLWKLEQSLRSAKVCHHCGVGMRGKRERERE
jgi:hypothetical protein